MEEQIKQAVEIAISGTSDYQLKQQAIQFLNDLKASPDGWQAFQLLLSSVTNQDQVRFVALQALVDYIPNLSQDSNFIIRNTLLNHFQGLISANQYDQPFLKNKLAECFASLFCANYLNSWNSFFKDLSKLIENENEIAIDQYLRILLAIHSEIGDQLIIRERHLVERNNSLKDAIRVNDMADLTLVWKKVLNDFKNKNESLTSDILKNTLSIIGGYVSWIEISLIVGDDYINLILQFLTIANQKVPCADTLCEIISKKMKPENKLQLLSLLNLTNIVNSLELDESEFVEHVAKLYNVIGMELSYILDSNDASNQLKVAANQQIINLFPFILTFLSNIYDDVSAEVFPFLSTFLTTLKKLQKQNSGAVTSTHLEILNTLLSKIILKMKYDSEDDGDDEDEISEFNEFRSKLKVFQDTIGAINSGIYMEHLYNAINSSIFETTGNDWREVELGLYELTNFSEGLRTNVLNIPKLTLLTSKPYLMFEELLLKTINSNVIQINHPLIQLLFFELIVRHYTFLNNASNKTDLTNHILGLFTTPLGLYNSNEKVQLRCWYLFFRFIKLTKPVLNGDLIQTLVRDLSNSLLVIEAEVPNNQDDESGETSDKFDSQLYLFETLGLLISLVDNTNIQLKLKLLDDLLSPIFGNLQKIISSKDQSPKAILEGHHLLMAIGTIARGFEYDQSPNKKYSEDIVQEFNNVAEVVLVTLENLTNFEIIRDAARFSFARFIPILQESSRINSHLSRLISQILASNNLKISELTDFLGFIGQIVHNFNKNDLIYQLLNDLFTPLTTKVYQVIEDKGENQIYEIMPDIQREKAALKKAFINLLINLTTNHVSSLLITQTNKATLPTILNNLLQEAADLNDLSIMKLALSSLGLLTKVFGNDKVNDELDKFGQGLTIEGISTYLLENLVDLSFKIPFNNTGSEIKFDVKDAQFRFVLDELANLLIVLKEVQNVNLANYLKEYFVSIQLPSQHGDDFIRNLMGLEGKEFKRYYTNFIVQFK